MLIPMYLGHHADKIKPIPRKRFRAAVKADTSLVGHVARFALSPGQKAAEVVVSFCRKSGLKAAKSQRMGLSPTLVNPKVARDAEIVGQLVTMDLCEHPRDQRQTPFTRMAHRPKTKPKTKRKKRKAKRMSEVKMPDLSDQQIAVLQKLDSIRREIETIDWWSGAIKMLWPGQANEVLGTTADSDSAIQTTEPDFVALALGRDRPVAIYDPIHDAGLTSGGSHVTAAQAKQYVDDQATRIGGMIR